MREELAARVFSTKTKRDTTRMLLQGLTHRPLWDFELSAIYLAEGFVVSRKRGVR